MWLSSFQLTQGHVIHIGTKFQRFRAEYVSLQREQKLNYHIFTFCVPKRVKLEMRPILQGGTQFASENIIYTVNGAEQKQQLFANKYISSASITLFIAVQKFT
ncbi:Hypothetical_protein [Hexamita inflata]|uniref:Hypothetical_protein n=1 Tax=Hexamita inflata TaxID=28002 RepID=A0AA86UWG9_9EUKA|nr:Hypothetical protein HINF_LOCUS8909 [Hexamita inflata]CAI9967467.1 Hypothetical protein HINF_LOCUS55112 [Hexamita inflata]